MGSRKNRVQSHSLTQVVDCRRQIAQLANDEAKEIVSLSPTRVRFGGLFKFLLRALHLSLRKQLTTGIVATLCFAAGRMSLRSRVVRVCCGFSLQCQGSAFIGIG